MKEPKQAEFLVHQRFPFDLVERIGVRSDEIRDRAAAALGAGGHRPPIDSCPDWYF